MAELRTEDQNLLDGFLTALQSINRYARRGSFPQQGQQMTRVQWMLLRHLRKSEQTTIGQLAEFMNVRPSTMSQMLDRLEKEHWVARTADVQDSRIRNVSLTQDGHAFVASVESAWHDRLLAPFSSLTQAEQSKLVELLAKVAVAARDATE